MEPTELKSEIKLCLELMEQLQARRNELQEELNKLEEQALEGSYFSQQDHSFYYVSKVDSTQPGYCNVIYDSVLLYDNCAAVSINVTSNSRMFRGMSRITEAHYKACAQDAISLIQEKIRVD